LWKSFYRQLIMVSIERLTKKALARRLAIYFVVGMTTYGALT
jgi:hypothetical protein